MADPVRFEGLTEKLGPYAFAELYDWLGEELKNRSVTRDEYREILTRMDIMENKIEQRFAQIDQRFGEMEQQMTRFDEQLDHFNERLDQFDVRMDRFEEQLLRMNDTMHAGFEKMSERLENMLKWSVSTIGVVGAAIAVLITISKFVG